MSSPNPNRADYSVFSATNQVSWQRLLRFEMRSVLGRLFFARPPPGSTGTENLLNLGTLDVTFPGWVNADMYSVTPWGRRAARRMGINWMMDLRYPWPCGNNFWDGIFCQHTLEHLYVPHAAQALSEMHRTLKPGGWVRVSVPDLDKYVRFYRGEPAHERFGMWETGAEAIGSLTQNWEHRSVWNEEFLGRMLTEAGFAAVRRCELGEGSDPRLLKDSRERAWESLYMEGRKG